MLQLLRATGSWVLLARSCNDAAEALLLLLDGADLPIGAAASAQPSAPVSGVLLTGVKALAGSCYVGLLLNCLLLLCRCGDAMELSLPAGSCDVAFSNWLLMYLGDAEVQQLARNMLSWVRTPC